MIRRLKTPYKRILFALILFLIIFFFILLVLSIYNKYRIRHALVYVQLQDNLDIEVYSKIKTSDLIRKLNGDLIEDHDINTTQLGKKEINFEYINEENIKIPYSFEINIVDKTKPVISLYNTKTVYVGDKDFKDTIFCGDNYDNKPKCIIKGEYDINTPGEYPITFIGIDSSNNISTHDMTLIVKEEPKNNYSNPFYDALPLEDIISKYKTKSTKIGIDVSRWQGKIDYKEVKKSKVEFVMIKLGGRDGINGELYLDSKFKDNIEGFSKQNIPIGVYFFSHARNKEQALEEAKFVVKNLKKYDIDLPIAFDWENFQRYRKYNMSFYNLNVVANTFMDYVNSKDYVSMLYSSKYYLENYWEENDYKTWLAHYTDKTDYERDYYIWQLTDKGKVNGIEDNVVDIDILYK